MYVNSQHKKGNDLLDQQKFEEAIKAFNEALKIAPEHPDILSHRGVCYLHMNRKKSCIDDLQKAKEIEPDNSYRYASMAYALDFFGDLDGAIALYEVAVKLDPDDAVAHNNLGLLLEKKGYADKAKRKFERADKLAKIEKKIFDDLDEKISPESPTPSEGTTIQPKKLSADKKRSEKEVIKDVFTKKSSFKEFLNFIKNGFKLKKND